MKTVIVNKLGLSLVVAVAGVLAWEADASACGGCFNPPETPTVVTDHKMVFAISKQQSTLYDQIQYTGAPESFGWVLPFAGDIEVGVSSDVLFATLDSISQIQILPPARNCPPQPEGCPLVRGNSDGASASEGGGVDVLKREVVGPYDTAQLKASDPKALDEWLTKNGFFLPESVKPVVTQYINEKFNFLALKLLPGAGVQAMKPVRVTTKSSSVALPLRMVAAGTGPKVGITLWIVAEGRYHPSNFDMFTITGDELSWDWTQNKSNYIDVRAQKNTAAQGRAWELEASLVTNRQQLLQTVEFGGPFNGGGRPALDPDGGTNQAGYAANGQKTADQVRDEDFAALFAGIPEGAERVTRIRADLDHAALDRDLLLAAAPDQAIVDRARQVKGELNEPICPVWYGCEATGSLPRAEAAKKTEENNSAIAEDDGCATTTKKSNNTTLAALGLGVVGFVLARRKRKST